MARPIGAAITRANDQIARFTRFYANVNNFRKVTEIRLSRQGCPRRITLHFRNWRIPSVTLSSASADSRLSPS